MELVILIFLTSGLFLGWSLGANDAANVFGTAVGTRMVRFTTAAVICSIFVILGAVISGSGAAHTLGKLGAINALGGSFMAAFSAAITVYMMTRAGLPVSTSQAIVGAIIGWNLYSGFPTDSSALTKIVATWIACPLLAGFVAVVLYKITVAILGKAQFHLIRLDAYSRAALIIAGAMGAYSLGANNIANVMGVFVSSNPFTSFEVGGLFAFSGVQQLFLIGALAIAVGVFTYSKKVMMTVGGGLMPLSPVSAWVVVVSHSIVLFLFASVGLESFLADAGLPTIPLVPVSSSQAVVGAVIGLGLLKGGRGINYRVLVNIASGWVTTPVIACVVCFVSLFFLQNVFNQEVYRDASYVVDPVVIEKLAENGQPSQVLKPLSGREYTSVSEFRRTIADHTNLTSTEETELLNAAEIVNIVVDDSTLAKIKSGVVTNIQLAALKNLSGQTYRHKWQLNNALAVASEEWRYRPNTKANKGYNKKLGITLDSVNRVMRSNLH